MFKKGKLKLSTIFVLGFTLILFLMTLAFSTISMHSVRNLGDYAITIFRDNTRRDAFMFFNETTNRATAEYSTYFEAVADLSAIISLQLKEELSETKSNCIHIPDLVKLSLYKNSNFYIDEKNKDFTAIYWGNKEINLKQVERRMSSIMGLAPVFKTAMKRNEGYFVNMWVHDVNGFSVVYPYNNFYEKYKDRKIFKNNFSAMIHDSVGDINTDEIFQVWSTPYIDIITKKPVLTIITPVFDESEKIVAIVGIDLSIDKLMGIMLSSNMLRNLEGRSSGENENGSLDGFIFIVDDDGNIIDLEKENYETLSLQKRTYELENYFKIKKVNLSESYNSEIRDLKDEMKVKKNGLKLLTLKGKKYILAYSHIRSVNWNMIFVAHEETLMESATQTHNAMRKTEKDLTIRFIVLILLFLILSILITLMFFRRFFLFPLATIRNEIKKMGDGNFDLNLKEEGATEIKELSSAFNLLGNELTSYMDNLKKESAARQAAETEIEIAARVQATILPQITSEFVSDKYQLYAKIKPAKNVSGDFYDFFFLDENRIALIIADVSGKGLSAAFFMGMCKVLIKSIALKYKLSPAEILNLVNNTLCLDNSSKMFVTVFLAYYDITTGELEYSNAGHHDSIVYSDDGEYETFGIMKRLVMGFVKDSEYINATRKLKVGETVLMYTDGVIESSSPEGLEYGVDRLKDVILKNKEKAIDDLCSVIIEDVDDFEKGNQYDDITVLSLKRLD